MACNGIDEKLYQLLMEQRLDLISWHEEQYLVFINCEGYENFLWTCTDNYSFFFSLLFLFTKFVASI